MLFDLKQFEHIFKERILKRGLKLFEKGELEFVERNSGFEYIFYVAGFNLVLKKKGDKLLSYNCSCSKNEYCEHLAAALFYFQQEALGISVKSIRKGKAMSGKITSDKEENLRKEEYESLVKFIREHKQGFSATELLSFLSGKLILTLFDVYEFQVEQLLLPYADHKKLDKQAIVAITKSIQSFVKNSRSHFKKDTNPLYLDLALVSAFGPLFSSRFTDDETTLFNIYHEAIRNLDLAYRKGLSKPESKAWFQATIQSIKTNKGLHSEAFLFLVPRMVSMTRSESELFTLARILEKRIYKVLYSHQFDKLLIARLQVALREWHLFKAAFSMQYEGSEVELIIAKAELDFCNGKTKKAFNLLEEEYEQVRMVYKNYYNDYLEYILENARRFNNREIEIRYLRESFVRRLFIVSKDLDRYLELLPEESRIEEIKGLIDRVKTKNQGYYFDKISMLLLKANMLEELILELKKQNNKFSLMHEIALKKFPEYTDAFLTLYMRHLSETLKQDAIYSYQVKVFTTAKEFLDKLPAPLVIELIKKLLDQVGKAGHLYRYINEMYDYPFLKEEGNYN